MRVDTGWILFRISCISVRESRYHNLLYKNFRGGKCSNNSRTVEKEGRKECCMMCNAMVDRREGRTLCTGGRRCEGREGGKGESILTAIELDNPTPIPGCSESYVIVIIGKELINKTKSKKALIVQMASNSTRKKQLYFCTLCPIMASSLPPSHLLPPMKCNFSMAQ